jgi:hypothetical protein
MEEEYRKCFSRYEISNLGNVRRKQLGGGYKSIKGSILNTGGGYKYFQVQRDGKRINFLFHHLVAKHFIGDRPEGLVIDHIDRNPLNNILENLRYCTQRENMYNTHKYRSDITENDKRLRRNIISRDRDRRNGRVKGNIRPKGLGSIKQTKNGNWRCIITINKIKYDKTLKTKEECEEYILNLKLLVVA